MLMLQFFFPFFFFSSFFQKKKEQKSPGILAKLAAQTADLYDQSYDSAVSDPSLNCFEGVFNFYFLPLIILPFFFFFFQ